MPSDAESFGWISTDSEGEERISTMVKLEKNDGEYNHVIVKREVLNSSIKGSIKKSEQNSEIRNGDDKHVRFNESVSDNTRRNKMLVYNYLEQNKHLTKSTNTCSYDVNDDEEIFLLQCPRSIDPDHLIGLEFLSKEKKKFKLGHNSYECTLSNVKNTNISILVPPTSNSDYRLHTFNILGSYIIKEKLKANYDIEIIEEEASVVPFPDNLKVRHPLFGASYKSQIKLPQCVKDKFDAPVTKLPKVKKIKQEPMDIVDDCLEVKKSKKRKADESLLEDNEPKKKIKKESMWTSETAIEKNLFDIPVKSKKKARESIFI